MMWYEVLQSDLIPINYMKRGERISIVQKNKIEDPEIYIHYYEASLSECRSLAICESRSLVPLHEDRTKVSCVIICELDLRGLYFILTIYSKGCLLWRLKKSRVSLTTTPLKAKMAIILGIAISPLKISAIVHTAETVM